VLDLRRLYLLRELSAHGTIAAVAEAHAYSPSAVSQQLSQLEREAGAQLLERVGRNVRLTEAAVLLVDHADALLARMERAEAEVARMNAEPRGTVRVASFQTVAIALLPRALSRLAVLVNNVAPCGFGSRDFLAPATRSSSGLCG
jgi:DNA-binding transcriptional LysR family regulator